MSLPKFMAPGFSTGNFDHVTVSIRDFAEMMKDPAGAAALTPDTRSRIGDIVAPRFGRAHRHLKTNPAIPQDVRNEADRYSRELVWSLNTFRSKIIRGQSHGSLDSSKLSRLASPGLAPREFDRLAASAYRRREHVQSVTVRPRIAIVGDMNNEIRGAVTGYMRTLGKLAYIIGEAAKLSGVEVCMIGSRGYRTSRDVETVMRELTALSGCKAGSRDRQIRRPHLATVLKGWNDDVTGSEYALFTDATTMAFSTIVWGTLNLLSPTTFGINSTSGAGGIEFARAQGANLVIAFGEFSETETPDMLFAPNAGVDDVVRRIVETLANGKAG